MVRAVSATVATITVVAVAACASTNDGETPRTSQSLPVPTAAPVAGPASSSVPSTTPGYLSQVNWFDGPWPLTVPDGVLACQPANGGGKLVTIASGGLTYWLNGSAQSTGRFADLYRIWRSDPNLTDTKVDLGALLRRALSMC